MHMDLIGQKFSPPFIFLFGQKFFKTISNQVLPILLVQRSYMNMYLEQ